MDISSHRSALLTQLDIDNSVAIVGITARHTQIISTLYPSSNPKLHRFPIDIPDPWHQHKGAYRECMEAMRTAMSTVLEDITTAR